MTAGRDNELRLEVMQKQKQGKSIGDEEWNRGGCRGVTFQCWDRGNFIGGESEEPRMGWRGRGAHCKYRRLQFLLACLDLAGP